MSRRPAKARAASGKAFASAGSSAFGAFSSSAPGSKLSYLAELPDFSSISDPNVIVSFKNLLKKDATTKVKALEDLVAYVEAHPYEQNGGTEEPILEAWVELYPRISIDNSRRVRELSHTLQTELVKSARKRMEKRIPSIVATWLAGTFDKDRVVSRNATEGLSEFLTSPEKVLQFWRRCQPQILEYVSSAILETTDTLSDERSTSTDDADAKYYRVLGGCLGLILGLLQKLDVTDLEKHQDEYNAFFEGDKVWTSATANDAAVRRQTCQLLMVSLEKRREAVEADLRRLSRVFIAKGLKSNQNGSAADYVKALRALTTEFPTVWTFDYDGKKSPSSGLRTFLEKGSQGSAVTFWDSLNQLFEILPSGILPTDMKASVDFMMSMRAGITNREEPRNNAVNAWSCYLNMVRRFVGNMAAPASPVTFAEETVFPLTEQFLFPIPDRAAWASGAQIPVLAKAYTLTATSANADVVQATEEQWERFKEEFKNKIRGLAPEASSDYERSQKALADEGTRWFSLSGKILEGHSMTAGTERPIPDIPAIPSLELLSEALSILKTRNWKPFGAAAMVESAFKNCPLLFKSSTPATNEVLESLGSSFVNSQETLLASSSLPYVVSSIAVLGDIPGREQDFTRAWTASIEAVIPSVNSSGALQVLARLVSSQPLASLARKHDKFQSEIVAKSVEFVTGALESGWALLNAAVTFDALSEMSEVQLAKELTAHLVNFSGQVGVEALKGLMLIAQKKPDVLSRDDDVHMSLMTSLLSLSERSNANPEVTKLRALLEHPAANNSNLLVIIQQNINDAAPDSLTVDTLVQQALQMQGAQKNNTDTNLNAEALLPDSEIWGRDLSVFLNSPLNPSLSLTSVLGGVYSLVTSTPQGSSQSVRRDRVGCSISGRMALYTSALMSSGFDVDDLPANKQVELIVYLSLTAEVAADQLTVMENGKIWRTLVLEDAILDAEKLVSSTRKLLNDLTEDASRWRDGSGTVRSQLVHSILNKLLENATSPTPSGLYSARVLSDLLQSLAEKHGFPSNAEEWLTKLDVLKSGPATVLQAVAILTGLGERLSSGKTISNFYNRLVSDVAGANLQSDTSLVTLVLLNTCMHIYEIGELPVAKNRLVFAVKQITSWLESPEEIDHRYAAEICRSLCVLLPSIQDVYGPYWERTVEFCIYLWNTNSAEPLEYRLPSIHASLRLMTTLQSLEEPNDDLVEILQEFTEQRSRSLLKLLALPHGKPTQPREIVDAIVCRQVEKLPLEHIDDISDLYELVAAESRTIQTAAFTVLHKAIPAVQEQMAVDVLLEKRNAQLPDELLSLLLEAPTLDAYSDEALAQFPTPIRSYLLTWHLVFDAFQAASYKVRSDYAEHLKTDNYIGPLMHFTFDVLGHSAAHGLNLAKADFSTEHIRHYDLKLADAESEKSMQWLLIHLFYLVLKHTPGLFKAWFIDCRSKQTKIAVEAWMTRFFSPIIVADALDDVAKWAATQEPPAEDEKELVVKVSRAAKEITAGYEVDEIQAAIAIKVPASYPLEGVSVVGVNRVAVNERKWQSWIMSTQGVITFSGGSIIDGLTTFRRNIVGALKGQTECAICYSIISSDKKMPDKRCGTCKNLFHRKCLYQWFQSSNQNTCPLCRTQIDYRRLAGERD